jgi:hypothetical protein
VLVELVAALGCSSRSPPAAAADALDSQRDAPDLRGSLTCGDKSCGANTICVEVVPGTDGGTPQFSCDSIPTACASQPTCACLKNAGFGPDASDFLLQACYFVCNEMGARSFACSGG